MELPRSSIDKGLLPLVGLKYICAVPTNVEMLSDPAIFDIPLREVLVGELSPKEKTKE